MIIDQINEKYPLEKKEIGDLETYKCSGMTFHNESYYAKKLGNVSYTEAAMPLNLMKMTSIIINPFEVDAPLISLDVVEVFGKYKAYVEIYNTTLDYKFNTAEFRKIAEDYKDYEDEAAKENWYDPLIVDRIRKSAKKNDPKIRKVIEESLKVYLNALEECPKCDIQQKKKKAKEYSDGLLEHGGPATDPVKKTLGIEKATRLFNDVLFGCGD